MAEQVRQELYRLVRQKEGVEVLELNIQPDHVHLVIWLPPKYAVSNFMGFLKGKMAIRLLNRNEHLMRTYWGRHLWSRGDCVSTVGVDEAMIRQSVKWQAKRERANDRKQADLFD